MKKKSLKHLNLGKKVVSKLNKNTVQGGAITYPTFRYCQTAGCGTQIEGCNSREVCETVEVDKYTTPIC